MTSKIIEEAISMTCDTDNDDIYKPLVYFLFNIVPIICPVTLSHVHSVNF